MNSRIPPWLFHALALLLLLLAALVYARRAKVMVDTPGHGDQAAYLELACNLREGDGFVSHGLSPFRPWPEITRLEGIRGPLYPLLISPTARRRVEYFNEAKTITLAMSLAGAAALYVILARCYNPALACLALALCLSNRHFITFSTELWCENLLLFLSFFAWLLWWRRGSPVLTGILAALALMAKKTMLPIVAIILLQELLVCLMRHRRNPAASVARMGWALRFIIPFIAVLAPWMAVNLASEGNLFNNTDLNAVFWIDQGLSDVWQVYDEAPPSLSRYMAEHSVTQIAAKFLSALLPQVKNFAALGDTVFFGWNLPLGWILWPLALAAFWGAWKIDRVKAGMLLPVVAYLYASFVWYSHIDVDPRFVYVLFPIMIVAGPLGLLELANRASVRRKSQKMPLPELPMFVMAVLLAASLASAVRLADEGIPSMPPDRQAAFLYLRENLPPGAIMCTGPSHWYPYLWLHDNKTLFVPSLDSLDELRGIMARFGADYLFIDPETAVRRRAIFSPHFTRGTDLPGFSLVGPLDLQRADFLLYKRISE